MKRNFSAMNAQQAPSLRQAWPLAALQIASTSVQRIIGGTVTARKYSASSVRIVLKTLPNRLARSQGMTPCVRGGGRSAGIGNSCVISAIGSALDQRDGAVVEVHQQRNDQTDRE